MKESRSVQQVDIQAFLYRKLKEQAAARGSSIRELVLAGVKTVLLGRQWPNTKRVQSPRSFPNVPRYV